MKKILVFLNCLILSIYMNAQAPQFSYKSIMEGDFALGQSIALDASGNVFTVGSFGGKVDFDPGASVYNLTSVGDADIFVAKYSASGSLIWVNQFGGTGQDLGCSLAIDVLGNLYITGTISTSLAGPIDFDPGVGVQNLSSAGGFDALILILDNNGNYKWADRFGSTGNDIGNSIAVSRTGAVMYVHTTGIFEGTVDFNPGASTTNLTSVGPNSEFISVLSFDLFNPATLVWAGGFTGSGSGSGSSIAVDGNGNIYTNGNFNGQLDFDPGVSTANLTAPNGGAFLSKLNKGTSTYSFGWVTQLKGNNTTDLAAVNSYTCLAIDASNNPVITGGFTGTINFNFLGTTTNLTTAGSFDQYVAKFNGTNGQLSWVKQFAGNTHNIGRSVAIDDCDNVYTLGEFAGTTDFNPGAPVFNLTSGSSGTAIDASIVKLNSSGSFIWAGQLACTDLVYAYCIAVEKQSRSIFSTGGFTGTVDFDPGSGTANAFADPSIGITHAFNHKMTQATLNLKCYIEGYYLSGGMMQPVLQNQGCTVGATSTETDFITVKLHSASFPYPVITNGSTTAMLNTDGTATCTFDPSVTPGTYYIEVNHRNALETWSASGVAIGGCTTTYDFTTSASQAYGSNMINMGSGIYAFYSGDIDQPPSGAKDQNIDVLDLSVVDDDVTNFVSGCFASDLNGDGNTDILDFDMCVINVNNFIFTMRP